MRCTLCGVLFSHPLLSGHCLLCYSLPHRT